MGVFRQIGRQNVCIVIFGLVILYLLYLLVPCDSAYKMVMVPKAGAKFIYDTNHNAIPYDDNMAIIFVGGMPRSGTTLMRAMLDAHSEIRCGEETRVIPRILGMRMQMEKSKMEMARLNEAGVTAEVVDSAVRAFILEIIAKHGAAAPHLCNKDPFALRSTVYLSQQFPNSKYILMIRDGRAVVSSIITRKVTITGFDLTSYRKCLEKWNSAVKTMYAQCIHVGSNRCMPVYYEQLALHPKEWMVRILQFLNIPWNDTVLHHEEFIGKPGGIALSKVEKSTDQVIKPVNIDALSKWVGTIPEDVLRDMDTIAPMLRTLGYDPMANPPNYGNPDPNVADNTIHIKKNADFWKQKEMEVLNNGADDGPQEAPLQENEKALIKENTLHENEAVAGNVAHLNAAPKR